ncbi:MAG: MSMEG_0567/Sll0786 family nitrogen starvation N-acetyltransferase [Xanthobacteraceae bacterium]
MIFGPFKPYLACAYQIKYATEAWERRGAAALRRQVFCDEQRLFHGDDRDAVDAVAIPIVAVSLLGVAADAVVGTVRIHQEKNDPDVWWGSRLAVTGPYRRLGAVGAGLIRLAVESAHARGCRRFLGNIQSQNVALFEHMHWRTLRAVELHGKPHHVMQADLDFYPPFQQPEVGFLSLPKLAA